MQASWFQLAQGVVSVRFRGGNAEALVNLATAGGLRLRDVRRTSSGETTAVLSVGDFFRLRPYMKQTGCRVHVTGRRGLPFLLDKLGRRKFFAAGMLLFVAGIYVLSSLVWNLEVTGNSKLSEERILEAAKAEGLFPFQWSFKLADTDVLSKRLTARLQGAAWVGVEKTGTKVMIRVVETTEPEPQTLYSPRHLIAAEDAVVTSIFAEAGRPVVTRNTRVKRGDILISGTLGEGANMVTVPAKGSVKGLVWHEYRIESPLERKAKVYTGERKSQWYLYLFGRTLQVSGFGGAPFSAYEPVDRLEQVSWRSWLLPFGRMKRTLLESRQETVKVTQQEAKTAGILQAKADVLSKAGPDAAVRAQNILHEKTENGKVYMDVLFEVEQSITAEMPLIREPSPESP